MKENPDIYMSPNQVARMKKTLIDLLLRQNGIDNIEVTVTPVERPEVERETA